MVISKGKVILPGADDPLLKDIQIIDGKITRIAADITGDNDVIDAEGLYVLPGGIDPHVHFDDPGFTSREDFYHGTSASASGGITTVIDMPCTSIPPVTDINSLKIKLDAVRNKAIIDYALYGGISGNSFNRNLLENIRELSAYVPGFKTYFISGMESFPRVNHYQFKTILHAAAKYKRPVLLHAEDYDYVTAASEKYKQEGNLPRHYYKSRPETAEILAVLNAGELAAETGGDLHIVHIGTAAAAALLEKYGISGETGPVYLEFDNEDFAARGSVLKVTPPPKSPRNRVELWKMIDDGTISFAASDHAPCNKEEKNTGSIWTDYAGFPGSGTLLPYLFSEGFMKNRISLKRLSEITSFNAARRYKLDYRKGSIEPGKDADFVLINPDKNWTVRGKDFYSKGKTTPFEGRTFKGRISRTILRGNTVYDDAKGICGKKGGGVFLTPEKQRDLEILSHRRHI